jgi:hypothetical protein
VTDGKTLQHPLHEARQSALGAVDDRVEVGRHQGVRMDLDTEPPRSFGQLGDEDPAFSIVDEDVLSIDAAIGEVKPPVLLR